MNKNAYSTVDLSARRSAQMGIRMNALTILMVVHNEAEYAKFSMDSIRMFADVDDLSVVIIDNHSEDGLSRWAGEQEDITYVYMDEGKQPFGKILNEVCRELQPEGDLLIMDPHYMLTPHGLSRLQTVVYQKNAIGGVAGFPTAFRCCKGRQIWTIMKPLSDGGTRCAPRRKENGFWAFIRL